MPEVTTSLPILRSVSAARKATYENGSSASTKLRE